MLHKDQLVHTHAETRQLINMENVIEVQGLTKRYKNSGINAVDGISFSVQEGEFFAFLGPNGAGKTTTISILTTMLEKGDGTVTIAGHDVDKHPNAVRKNIGVMFQNQSIDNELTGEENIRVHCALYGVYNFSPFYTLMNATYKRRVQELADVIGLHEVLFKLAGTYSGGMKRKLEIIRSLIHRPKILFLDEPSSGLDPVSRKNLWEYLHAVRERDKTTIFLTTHYLDEAEGADNVCIVNKGKIMLQGTPDELKKKLLDERLVLDAKDREALRTELKAKKIQFVEEKFLTVQLGHKGAHAIIKSIETPLSVVKVESPSLEEAYIRIIER